MVAEAILRGGGSMTIVDMTKEQCAELANYLRSILNNGMGAGCFDKMEMLVLARLALEAAEDLPENVCSPAPPPTSMDSSSDSPRARGGAAEAAEFKRATLARLEEYRRAGGMGGFTPLAVRCKDVDGKSITPELLGRMLNRERFPIGIWRSVAAALDDMEKAQTLEVMK